MRKMLLWMLALSAFSCKQSNEVVEEAAARIALTVRNVPPLEHAHYQLWATFFPFNKPSDGDSPTHEDEFVLLGEFAVTDNGTVQSLNGGIPQFALARGSNPQLLRDIVISIEFDHEFAKPTDSQPVSILMGGAFRGTERTATAEMTLAYADAFKSDFSSASGRCAIVAPTSPADSNSGIWFVELGSTPSPGLRNLPALPSAWRYEGWVIDVSGSAPNYISTGRFSKTDSADSDGAGPGGGSGTAFNFPGQDFVGGSFRPDLTNQLFWFMVTIEPQPDNSSKPFFLTLLFANRLTLPPTQRRAFALNNSIANTAPTARVIVER